MVLHVPIPHMELPSQGLQSLLESVLRTGVYFLEERSSSSQATVIAVSKIRGGWLKEKWLTYTLTVPTRLDSGADEYSKSGGSQDEPV